jgi:hypothetical protein
MSSLEILNAAWLQLLLYPPQLTVAQGTLQPLATNTFVAMSWATPSVDTYVGWSAANPTRYTPKVAGTYLVKGTVAIVPNGTGGRTAQVCKNGVANVVDLCSIGNSGASFNSVVQVTATVACNGSTDYFELYADQNSGASLNTVITLTQMTAQLLHF